ncbi:MAG: uracil-DNA glycosylase family protein [Hyphomicrobiales bacterium]|nr:uracil-DNA glycosylase family protein [Hyphomicrobiales bacterium]
MAGGTALDRYAARIGACRICLESPQGAPLPYPPRPVLRVSRSARLLIAGQAPGLRVHRSGLPFDDASGDRLRAWLDVDRALFYDRARIAIAPMGFCFPGYDAKGSDLPPRVECATAWRDGLMDLLPQIELIVLVGGYAQRWHFARAGAPLRRDARVGAIVRNWRDGAARRPQLFPLPHPSWRNTGWLKANPWFESDVLPDLRAAVARAVSG